MATSQAPSSTNAHHGYWVEPFVDIIRGERLLPIDEFNVCAEILYDHRLKGNPLFDNVLESKEGRTRAIQQMHEVYCLLNGESSLVKRATLLNTLFMQTIAQNIQCPLNEEEQKYVTETTLRTVLDTSSATDLLNNETCKAWLINYRLGCSVPSVIASHTDLFSGYSEEEKSALYKKRQEVSMRWYSEYKEGIVTKTDIQLLLDKLKGNYLHNEDAELVLENAFMQTAFEGYNAHALDFPPEKNAIYWNAIFVALTAFLKKAS